jgi:hypothetical protein
LKAVCQLDSAVVPNLKPFSKDSNGGDTVRPKTFDG